MFTALDRYGADELSEVMEVYDLCADMERQLAERRAWRVPVELAGSQKDVAVS